MSFVDVLEAFRGLAKDHKPLGQLWRTRALAFIIAGSDMAIEMKFNFLALLRVIREKIPPAEPSIVDLILDSRSRVEAPQKIVPATAL